MRLHFLDNVKVALVALVVVHHAGQAYGPTDYWPIRSAEQLALLGPFFEINGAFFMGLFFMISAYFLPGAIYRKGPRQSIKDRLQRLGIPLLFMAIIVFGPITYFVDEVPGSFWHYLAFDYIGTADFEIAHLWFVSLLLVFTLCYWCWRVVRRGDTDPKSTIAEPPSHLAILGFTAALIAANALVRYWFPVGTWVEVLPLLPVEIGRLPQYLGFFLIGLLASRRGWLLTVPLKQAMVWGGLGFVSAITVYLKAFTVWIPDALWLLQEALIGVGFCIALPIMAREFWNRSNAIVRKLADSAFAAYLIHILVVYILQDALEASALGLLTKFATVSILGLVISFAISHYLRRIPQLRAIL